MMNRPYNFGAGPAMLPDELLREAQAELLDWQGSGLSVMETGHRTDAYMQLMTDAEQLLRRLLEIPETYHVLFLGGAARTQFGMIPLNFIQDGQTAGYLITGVWSFMAFQEAARLKQAYCLASSETAGFLSVPTSSDQVVQDNSAYLYYTPNETVNGVRCSQAPFSNGIPVVADMTSCLLSEPLDIKNFGLIFAGAQKNIANAGLTVIIIRKEWLNAISQETLPSMMDYRLQAAHHSLYATPPTFNCYLALKMFQWIERQGGVSALYEANMRKAALLYDFIDASTAWRCDVAVADRSLMNVCFRLRTQALEELFIDKAAKNGLLALKGHRTTGGLRASLYNAMPVEGVERLISFMHDFSKEHNL